MVSTGFKDVIGSWNTTATERPRNLRRRSGLRPTRSCPSNNTRPDSLAFFGSNCRIARQHGFSAARFPDNSKGAAGADSQTYLIDRAKIAARGRQIDRDIFDGK